MKSTFYYILTLVTVVVMLVTAKNHIHKRPSIILKVPETQISFYTPGPFHEPVRPVVSLKMDSYPSTPQITFEPFILEIKTPSPKKKPAAKPGDGLTFLDFSHIRHDSSMVNLDNVTWTTGISGSNALHFNGYDSTCSYQNRPGLDCNYEGTLELVFRMDAFVPHGGLVHKGEKRDWSDESYSLQFQETSDQGVRFSMINTAGEVQYLRSTYGLEQENWYHLVVTWDRDRVVIYINGEKDTEKVNTIGMIRSSSGPLQVGSQLPVLYNQELGTLAMNGVMDRFMMYRRLLSEKEIKTLNRSLPREAQSPFTTSVPLVFIFLASSLFAGSVVQHVLKHSRHRGQG